MEDQKPEDAKPSEDQFAALRKALISDLDKKYAELITFLRTLPINQNVFNLAYANLDLGIVWAEKMINTCQFITPSEQPAQEIKIEAIDPA